MAEQDLETVASVIARLGAPPPDIADQWMVDAKPYGDAALGAEFDVHSPVWRRMMLDDSGRARPVPTKLPLSHKSERRQSTLPDVPDIGPEFVVPPDAGKLDDSSESPAAPLDQGPQPHVVEIARTRVLEVRSERRTKVWLVVGLVTVVAASGLAMFMQASSPREEKVETVASKGRVPRRDIFSAEPIDDAEAISQSAAPRRAVSRPKISRSASPPTATVLPQHPLPNTPAPAEFENVTELLKSIDTADPEADRSAVMNEPDVPTDSRDADLSLDSFLPAAMTGGEAASTPNTAIDEASPVDITKQALDITNLQDEGAPVDQIVPQPTAAISPPEPQTTAVTLPSPPTANEDELPLATAVLAVAAKPSRLLLEFPIETPLRLQAAEDGWHVMVGGPALPIGIFEMGPDSGEGRQLQFRWLAGAADSPLAASLAHGRIRTSDRDVVYLRPQLQAAAVLTGLSERDTKLKWLLGGPILNVPTRLRLKLDLPEDVAVQWIESIDENSPQRARAIAVLTLKDTADSGALAIRIEVQVSNSFSMRLRYGARLGPGLPWQWTDAKLIRASLDATTQQLKVADDQLLQLETAISRAEKIRARRQEVALEIQRDAIEEAVRNSTLVAKRLAELDQLVALLKASGKITVNLNVLWPDGDTQTLLSLNED